jgi:hypothetical protein
MDIGGNGCRGGSDKSIEAASKIPLGRPARLLLRSGRAVREECGKDPQNRPGRSKAMFVLAGAAASVLGYLGSLHAASSVLQGSAVKGAAASRPAFDIGSAMAANHTGASTAADGGGKRSSPATMDALISMQGQANRASTGSTASASAGSINLLERMIAQHAQLSTAASVGHSLSTFV